MNSTCLTPVTTLNMAFPLSTSESEINKFQSTVQTGEKAEWNKGNALGQNDHSLS